MGENKYKQMWEELEKKLATILTANEMIDAFLQEQHGIGEYHAYTIIPEGNKICRIDMKT